MALFQCKIFSKELFRSVNVNVTLPTPDSGDCFFDTTTKYPKVGEKYQVLWLLHGFSADESDWQRFSSIERYAQEKKIAVVMPDGYNSMYANNRFGAKYYNFYTEELPMVLRSLLPLSEKKEHNFIAGLSMGGYGAFKAAFTKPEQYGAAASLSGGLIQELEDLNTPGDVEEPVKLWRQNVYGENETELNPETEDLRVILEKQMKAGVKLPALYQCCGTEDFIYQSNVKFRDYMRALGVDFTYEEGPGVHNFDFWDPYIRKILNWLPLTGGLVD